MKSKLSRRSALKSFATGAAALGVASVAGPVFAAEARKWKGNIHHSVSAWCYGSLFNAGRNKPAKMTFEEFCQECARMGLESVELLGPDQWPAVKKAGLTCAMCNGPDGIGYGWNRVEHHDDLLPKFEAAIPEVAANGFPNIITFSGNRKGKDKWGEYTLSDEEGLENCVKGLKRLVPIAEKHKVNVILELLNSKVDHKGYMADKSAWGIELCKRVGSERLKLLFDIYHMQIMEGDIIRSIQEHGEYFGHYHTGGNPGRHEIDDTQELNYTPVMKAIVARGYKGFVGQEFVPARPDALASLLQSIEICDV